MDDSRTGPKGPEPGLKVPPHSLEAEAAVLASVLINNDLMGSVVEILRAEDFYQGLHRAIYAAMTDLFDRGRPIDVLTLPEELAKRGGGDPASQVAYLSELVHNVPTTVNALEYARLVKEKSILRRTIAVSSEIAAAAFQGVPDLDAFLDRTEQAIYSIAEEKLKPTFWSMAELAKESMKEIERLYEKAEPITGIPSGFKDLDRLTAGFQPGDLVILAARPSMGKTSLALNIALHAALHPKNPVPVGIFSLEMSRQQLVLRMICSEARVNFQRVRTGFLAQDEINRIVGTVGQLSEAPVYTDDSAALSALEMRARARRLRKERKVGLLIVDYLQMMRGMSARGGAENRAQEISEISRSLKALAKDLSVPVIAISQLNRGVEARTDKRPQMSDLRDSGAIEQDADLILFIYREEVYGKEQTPDDRKGIAEVIIGKQRNGPIGTVQLAFLPQYTRFEVLARDYV